MDPVPHMQDAPASTPAPARNRRRMARHKIHSPAYVSTEANISGAGLDLNEVLDLSPSGMSFQAPAQLASGRRLKLCLDLPETTSSVRAIGQVVWSEPAGRTGVRFLKLRGAASAVLAEWLFVNALVACAQSAAVQARAENSLAEKPSAAEAQTPAKELPTLPQTDYAAILSKIIAIRQQVETDRHDLSSRLQLLAQHAQVFTDSTGAAIALGQDDETQGDETTMTCRASAGMDAPGLGARFQVNSGFSGACIRGGVALRCDDTETDGRVDRESCRALGIRSILAVPVRSGGAIMGLIEVFSRRPNAFATKDRVFLQRLTELVPFALQCPAQAAPAESSVGRFAVSDRAPNQGSRTGIMPNPLAFQELGGDGVFPTDASAELPQPAGPEEAALSWRHSHRLRWIGITAGALALLVAVTLLWPEFRSRFARPARASPLGQPPAQASVPKSPLISHAPEDDITRLRRLAGQDDATAQFALGAHYATGDSIKQDYTAAAHWFAQAAEQGNVPAQATLGAYYWSGTGVPKDLDRAYFWSILALAGGDEGSKYRVSALGSQMTRGQVVAAQEEANDWLRQHESGEHTPSSSTP